MNLQTEKLQLMERIIKTQDAGKIRMISQMIDNNDPWDEYSDELKISVEKGLKEIEVGKTSTHNEVMNRHSKLF